MWQRLLLLVLVIVQVKAGSNGPNLDILKELETVSSLVEGLQLNCFTMVDELLHSREFQDSVETTLYDKMIMDCGSIMERNHDIAEFLEAQANKESQCLQGVPDFQLCQLKLSHSEATLREARQVRQVGMMQAAVRAAWIAYAQYIEGSPRSYEIFHKLRIQELCATAPISSTLLNELLQSIARIYVIDGLVLFASQEARQHVESGQLGEAHELARHAVVLTERCSCIADRVTELANRITRGLPVIQPSRTSSMESTASSSSSAGSSSLSSNSKRVRYE